MNRMYRIFRNAADVSGGLLPLPATSEKTFPTRTVLFGIFGKLVGFVLLFCAGCQGPTAKHPIPLGPTPGYLTAGDVLKISFPAAPELNQDQKIGTDGTLSLPLVGVVHAAGKSPAELQRELTDLYKPQLQNSEVIVAVESRAIPVVVSGAVQKPGKIVFERPATILEAIMEAGGFTPEANLKKVSLIRIVKGQHQTEQFDLRPVINGKPTRAVYISGGDVVYVPEKVLNF